MDERGLLLLDLLEMVDDPSVPLGSLDIDLIAHGFRDDPATAVSRRPDRLLSPASSANRSQS